MKQRISSLKPVATRIGCLVLAVSLCAQQSPPALEETPPVFTLEDTPVSITVRLGEPLAADPETVNLRFSPNPELATATISGAGVERVIRFDPLPDKNGTEVLELLAYGSSIIARSRLLFQILPVNDPLEISPLPSLQLPTGLTQYALPVSVRDVDNPSASLR